MTRLPLFENYISQNVKSVDESHNRFYGSDGLFIAHMDCDLDGKDSDKHNEVDEISGDNGYILDFYASMKRASFVFRSWDKKFAEKNESKLLNLLQSEISNILNDFGINVRIKTIVNMVTDDEAKRYDDMDENFIPAKNSIEGTVYQ